MKGGVYDWNWRAALERYQNKPMPKRHDTPHATLRMYRCLTIEELKHLGGHAEFLTVNGDVRDCKINGAVKLWKTRPLDADVPVKYGLYEYARLQLRGGVWVTQPLVKPITEEENRLHFISRALERNKEMDDPNGLQQQCDAGTLLIVCVSLFSSGA